MERINKNHSPLICFCNNCKLLCLDKDSYGRGSCIALMCGTVGSGERTILSYGVCPFYKPALVPNYDITEKEIESNEHEVSFKCADIMQQLYKRKALETLKKQLGNEYSLSKIRFLYLMYYQEQKDLFGLQERKDF